MKKFNKFLTIGLIATSLATGALLAGCGRDKNAQSIAQDVHDGCSSLSAISDKEHCYIVISENGIETLHKGEIHSFEVTGMYSKSGFPNDELIFNCGEDVRTINYNAYRNEPDAKKYDCKCEKCFGE